MSTELPDGWRIERVTHFSCNDIDYFYAAQRWGTYSYTRKRLLRRGVKVTQTGWHNAGFSSMFRDETVDWIQATVRAMAAAE